MTEKTETKKLETNRTFAETNPDFKGACEAAGVKVTRRQASKYRSHKGTAYRVGLPKMNRERNANENPAQN